MSLSYRRLSRTSITVLATTLILCIVMTPQAVNATLTVITPSSADNYTFAYQPTDNYGTVSDVRVRSGDTTYIMRSIVMFDLSTIPSGSVIVSARLSLYYFVWGQSDPAGRVYTVYRVTEQWSETGSTWNDHDSGLPWTTAGGVWTAEDSTSATVPSAYGWMRWDVTGIIRQWIEHGQPNYGFIVRDSNDVTGGYTEARASFCSREYPTDPALRPMLEIEYNTRPVGGVVMPTNKLAITAPYLALAGLVAVVSAVVVVKRRRD